MLAAEPELAARVDGCLACAVKCAVDPQHAYAPLCVVVLSTSRPRRPCCAASSCVESCDRMVMAQAPRRGLRPRDGHVHVSGFLSSVISRSRLSCVCVFQSLFSTPHVRRDYEMCWTTSR